MQLGSSSNENIQQYLECIFKWIIRITLLDDCNTEVREMVRIH